MSTEMTEDTQLEATQPMTAEPEPMYISDKISKPDYSESDVQWEMQSEADEIVQDAYNLDKETRFNEESAEPPKGTVIVITSGKGGVGKTTSVANIGTWLAICGEKVLLIDTDIGLRNLDVVMGLENRIVYDLVDVVEKKCRLRQAIIKDKRYDGLHLLPAAQTRDKSAVSPEQMIELCNELRKEFSYILIDCPAGIEQGFKNAIAGADKAIVVTTPEVSAVRDADRIIGLLEANEVRCPQLLINKIRMDMVKRGDMMTIEDIIDILATDLIGVIPDDQQIVVSTNKGEPAVTDSKSFAGKAYKEVVRRILGENVPITTGEDEGEGFMAKMFRRILKPRATW